MLNHFPDLASRHRYPVFAAILLLCGCMVGPDYTKPANDGLDNWRQLPAMQTVGDDISGPGADSAIDNNWWRQFNDPLLTNLIERAAKDNLTLQNAAALLAQSRAQRGIAAADQFPVLNGNASYSRVQASQEGILNLTKSIGGGGGAATSANGTGMAGSANGVGMGAVGIPSAKIPPFDLYQFGFDAAWELDLWGRVSREQEMAQAGVTAAREQHYAAQLSILAEVAKVYFELRRLQNNLDQSRQQLNLAREQFDLIGFRRQNGIATQVDLENARLAVDNIQNQIPLFDQQIEQASNQLCLLLGLRPGELNREIAAAAPMPAIPWRVNLGLPSELAERRPDIRAAEANLHKALAAIGMATADFYPRFTLSGSAGLQSLKLSDLANWSALQYALGPAVSLPIFQGGRLKSTLELREAEHRQAAVNYQNTVLSAWHEIDNNLAACRQAKLRQQTLDEAVAANTEITGLDEQRFQGGVSDYITVLQAKIALARARQSQVDGLNAQAGNFIALYKALGGGWRLTDEQQAEEPQK